MPVSPTRYYIAVHDADKTGLLAGPYNIEPSDKLRDVVMDMACSVDCRAWFYTFSLAKSKKVFNTVFGLIQED